jgi:hypothetical protein
MWSDTLLLAERAHLQRLALWGVLSVLAGTALVAALVVQRARSPLLTHFAIQTAAWGAIDLAIVAVLWRGLVERDLAGATHLDRLLWLNVGLDFGYIGVGLALAIVGWQLGRRLGLVGAGTGIVVQGLALLLLDAHAIDVIGRLAIPL